MAGAQMRGTLASFALAAEGERKQCMHILRPLSELGAERASGAARLADLASVVRHYYYMCVRWSFRSFVLPLKSTMQRKYKDVSGPQTRRRCPVRREVWMAVATSASTPLHMTAYV